jgi:hypothetical protein
MVQVNSISNTNNIVRRRHDAWSLLLVTLVLVIGGMCFHGFAFTTSESHQNLQSIQNLLLLDDNNDKELDRVGSDHYSNTPSEFPDDFTRWDDCDISKICERHQISSNQETTNDQPKPLWLSGYPVSGDEILRPFMIDTLFQQHAAGKNFYTKKCVTQKNTITATCSQIHPMVGITPLPIDRVQNFNSHMILLVRNPAMAIAAHFQEKANKYHKVIGQVPITDWRRYRNEYTVNGQALQPWLNLIHTWKSYSPQYYNVTLYIQYEKLFDFREGPQIVQQLIRTFQQAGFTNHLLPIIDDDNDGNRNVDEVSCAECIWYKSITKDRLIQYHKYGYEFQEYKPGYTVSQRDYLLEQIQSLVKQYENNDLVLHNILNEYYNDIQHNTIIDKD